MPVTHGTAVVRFEPAGMAADPALLTATELTRRDRLRRAEDRTAYVAAHVLVRLCAAGLLGVPVEEVRIVQTCPRCGTGPGHGVPSVIGHPDVGVSLSHGARHVAAVAAWGPCGIDVETMDDDRVVLDVLSDRERTWLAAQPEPGRAFRRLWVRKESLIKSGAAALDDAAYLDVLAETTTGALKGDQAYGEWSAPDAVGAWVVLGTGRDAEASAAS